MVEACVLQGEMQLGWDEECEQAAITDWEASKLVKFAPSIGTEIRLTRPAVIISGTAFNVRSKVTLDLAPIP